MLLNVAHNRTWGCLQIEYRPCLFPGPCWGGRVLAAMTERLGSRRRTHPGEAGSTAGEQDVSFTSVCKCPKVQFITELYDYCDRGRYLGEDALSACSTVPSDFTYKTQSHISNY